MTRRSTSSVATRPDDDPQVSSQSRFSDHVWALDVDIAGFRADQKTWRWGVRLANGSRLTDPQHADWLDACRRFVWSLASDPPQGYVRASPATLLTRLRSVSLLVQWMSGHGLWRFADMDAAAFDVYRAELKARRGRDGKKRISPGTLVGHLAVCKMLFVQREKLVDALTFDPLPGETAGVAAGATRANRSSIPFIPDALAVDIMAKALQWVEHHEAAILERRDAFDGAFAAAAQRGLSDHSAQAIARRTLQLLPIIRPARRPLVDKYSLDVILRHLHTACFIVIAGLVGMRVSEILSLKVGAIEHRSIGESSVTQSCLVAQLYKTSGQRGGREERWLVPAPVVRAVAVLERWTAPLRAQYDDHRLFIIPTARSRMTPITAMQIGYRIREFAEHVDVPHHGGAPWQFSAHQFRKTFARFVAKRDRTQLLALADHFKHVSVAMTAKGYVGTDFDLFELVAHEAQVETADALDRLLSTDRLAGRMGARLANLNAKFRGRAGTEVRRDYIKFILAETDLSVHACEYGWCVFQAETARCGGDVAPSGAERAPSVCLSCANFAVDERHRLFWSERRARNAALIERASPLARAALDDAVAQCDEVLRCLDGGGNV
jgi:integrase